MAFRLTPPQIQYLDINGNPLVGGQLFFYQTETSTPAETFADSGLTIPNPNPIVLDQSGSCPAPFLASGQLYKVVLEDVNGAVVWTCDPVSDPTAAGESVTSSFAITDQQGTPRSLFLQTAGSNRFALALDAVNESGNNAGSNLYLTSYNDEGSANQQIFEVNRATGQLNILTSFAIGGQAFGPSSLVPSGAVQAFAMSAPPAGWLAADGSSYSQSKYPSLFAAIGTTFGPGSDTTGATTFQVPDARGVVIRGLDDGRGLDPNATRALGSYQADAFQDHAHNYQESNSGNVGGGGGPALANNGNMQAQTSSPITGSSGVTPSVANQETRMKNIALYYCIKI